MLRKISELVWSRINKTEKLKEVYLKANWEKIVGDLSKKSSLNKIEKGIAFLNVENSACLHFMTLKKEEYKKKFNEILEEDYIKDLNFKLKKI
ncbi:MAG: DciA family protein [Fusobacteriaceae bacterium]